MGSMNHVDFSLCLAASVDCSFRKNGRQTGRKLIQIKSTTKI